jgi:hypothetical protein
MEEINMANTIIKTNITVIATRPFASGFIFPPAVSKVPSTRSSQKNAMKAMYYSSQTNTRGEANIF